MRDERKNSHPEKTKESSSHLTSPLPVPAVLRVVRRRGDIWEGRAEDRSDWGSIVPGSTGSGRLYCPHQGCSDSLRSAGGEADSYCWRVSQKGITVSQGQCLTRTQCHFPLRVSFLSFFFFFFFCRMGCREETLELQQPATLLPTFDFQCLILRGRVLSLWSLRSLFTFTTEHKHTNWLVVSCHCHHLSLSVPVCRWGSVTTLSLSVGRKLRFDFLKGELSQSHRQTERQAGSCGSCERKPLVDCGLLVNCLCVSSLMGLIPCAVVDIEQLSASCVMPVNALTINPTNSGN